MSVTDTDVQVDECYDLVDDQYFKIEWFSGTGKGGQHRNKKQNSCRVIHTPTGLTETRQGRKRESNLRDAKQALLDKLNMQKRNDIKSNISESVKSQVGSGMRGDKIRTYRFQEDKVTDHQLGKTLQLKRVFRGGMDKFWN